MLTESPDNAVRAAGRRVLAMEAEALLALADSLEGAFDEAVDILADASGRVIVTGMGKSGHVAVKIASTLASTGTPAHFVHPGEAAHGDLGMIARGDVLLALSNSGGTAELAAVIAHAARSSVPLIAVTANADSPLAGAARLSMVLPPVSEACPMGLAPTTSTTMMLALGDALAVALLERKGFSADDFRTLHPGGSLGQSLQLVSDIMHDGDAMPLIGPDTLMAEALIEISSKTFGCVGVTDGDGVLQMVDMADFKRRRIGELSTGQQQRALIARALIRKPELLVMDEPIAGVDVQGGEELYMLLRQLRAQGVTILIISHDVGAVMREAGTVACMNCTLLCHCPPQELTEDDLVRLYGFPVEVLHHGRHHDHHAHGEEAVRHDEFDQVTPHVHRH